MNEGEVIEPVQEPPVSSVEPVESAEEPHATDEVLIEEEPVPVEKDYTEQIDGLGLQLQEINIGIQELNARPQLTGEEGTIDYTTHYVRQEELLLYQNELIGQLQTGMIIMFAIMFIWLVKKAIDPLLR